MKDHKFNLILIFVIFGSIILCALLGFIAVRIIPQLVKGTFGNPSEDLERSQVIIYSLRLLLNYRDLTEPVGTSQTNANFVIEPGETALDVARNLEKAGFIRDASAFSNFLIYAGIDRNLQAGHYQLNSGLNAIAIAQTFLDVTPESVNFIILPGWRAEEIAAILPTSGLSIPVEEFMNIIRNPHELNLPNIFNQITNLEGLIMPGSYEIRRNITIKEFLQEMINVTGKQFTPEIIDAFKKQGLDPYQALILASIVQREAVIKDEGPIIASVFINRQNAGMLLQSDPTVQYAIGYDQEMESWWKNPLTSLDLQFDSPYNSYVYYGLPPTPICSVDVNSLTAVAFPAETDYYYFRSACDESGRHVFSETYEQHQMSECK